MPSMAKGFLRRTAHSRQRLLNYPVRIVTVRLASLGEIGEGFINLLRSLSAAYCENVFGIPINGVFTGPAAPMSTTIAF